MSEDWLPVEKVAKNDKGEFQVLHDGAWKPAQKVAKNEAGKYVALGVAGGSAPGPVPVLTSKEASSRGLHPEIPGPSGETGEAWAKKLLELNPPGKGKEASFVENAGDIASGMASGAVSNLAAIPALGVAGKGLSMAGKAIPKLAEVGTAVSEVGSQLGKVPWQETAKAGALIGGATSAVVDYLRNTFKMSEETASNVVMAATVAPQGAAAAMKRMFPQLSSTDAAAIVKKLHGAGSDLLTQGQHSEGMQKILGMFGGGGPIKPNVAPVAGMLEAEAGKRASGIQQEGAATAESLQKGIGRAGRIAETVMPGRAEASRVKNLGPDTTSSELGDEIRMQVLPKAQAASTSRQEAGRQGWDALQQESQSREATGNFITDTDGAKKAVAYIDDLIKANWQGLRKISENNPIFGKLRNFRERILGDVVDNQQKPKFRSLVNEIINSKSAKGRGINSSLRSEFDMGVTDRPGLFRNDGMTFDQLAEFAVEKGWVSQADVDMANQSKTGGSHDFLRDKIKKHLSGDEKYHPSEFDKGMAYEQSQGNKPRRIGMEEFDVMRRQLKALGDPSKTGYDADLGAKARDLEKLLAGALKEHAPNSFEQRILDYRDAAVAEEEFKTRLAKSLTERDPADPMQMKTAAHRVAEQVFAGRDSAMSFKRMIGGDQEQFDRLGLGYVSSSLKGMDAKQAEKWLAGSYRDWESELSPAARGKVKDYLTDLKKSGELAKGAEKRGAERVAKLEALPGQTEKRVADSTAQLLGGKKPVDRIKELILTPKQNKDEVKAVFDAINSQPGGKQAFQQAVEAVIKEEATGAGAKTILETFDNRIADTLLNAGTHTPDEVIKLRGLVSELDAMANAKVATSADYEKEVQSAITRNQARAAIWGVIGAIAGAGMIGSGQHAIGAAALGGESAGIYFSKNAFARNRGRIHDLIGKIIADKELYKAAIAEPTESNKKRLMGMLAQKAALVQTGEAVERKAEKEAGVR